MVDYGTGVLADRLSLTSVRLFVSANRWATAVALVAIILAFLGGVMIGLSPVLTVALAGVVVIAGFGSLAWRSRIRQRDDQWGAGIVLAHFAVVAFVVFGMIQGVPYGRDHNNPPVDRRAGLVVAPDPGVDGQRLLRVPQQRS